MTDLTSIISKIVWNENEQNILIKKYRFSQFDLKKKPIRDSFKYINRDGL